jgi:UDP-N-acetylmuramate: L-alanyl-gamma-D-glutamyl-meso-diaminopimelate ligase
MKIHILGICGTFMGGLAILAREAGFEVEGSDASVYPPMSTQLQEQGIQLRQGYAADNLDPAPDQVVVGNAMSRGNAAIEAMLDKGLNYTSGPQWLAEHLLQGRWVLAVAGTHGKTSTASMLAWILEAAGLKPGFLIGGVPNNFGVSARLGEAPFFVVEADEYDTAFFDKRSKFVHYRPRTLILNNLEFDHADIFPDLAAIQRAIAADGSNFAVLLDGKAQGEVSWTQLGVHNMHNALSAIVAARHVGVPVEQAIAALNTFEGVRRRLEVRGEVNGITVYDDFAHHPTAIATTLAGLRKTTHQGRLLAILEPRSNTMRLGVHRDQLAASLSDADAVWLYQPDDLSWDIHEVTAGLTVPLVIADTVDELVTSIVQEAQPGDRLVVMSNGGFGGIHEKLLEQLAMD